MSGESSQEVNDGTVSARVMSEMNNQGYSVWKDELAQFAGARSSLREWAEEKGFKVFFCGNSYVIHKEGVNPREVLGLANQDSYDISDEEIEKAFEGTNFGENVINRNELAQGLLKAATGYYNCHTLTCILIDMGLAVSVLKADDFNFETGFQMTDKGKKFLYECFKDE